MITVWKYELGTDIGVSIAFAMPHGAKVLSVANQFDCVVMWAEVDTDFVTPDLERRTFYLVGTGHTMPVSLYNESVLFHGTVLLLAGITVAHVYEFRKQRVPV